MEKIYIYWQRIIHKDGFGRQYGYQVEQDRGKAIRSAILFESDVVFEIDPQEKTVKVLKVSPLVEE